MKFSRSGSFSDPGQTPRIICLSIISKDFSYETTGTISIKFHMKPPSKGGNEVYKFGTGHITNVAAKSVDC